jgi:hypothetical protein
MARRKKNPPDELARWRAGISEPFTITAEQAKRMLPGHAEGAMVRTPYRFVAATTSPKPRVSPWKVERNIKIDEMVAEGMTDRRQIYKQMKDKYRDLMLRKKGSDHFISYRTMWDEYRRYKQAQ